MTCCTGRCTLIFITFLQLAFTIFRQVFDFLGFVWIPIVGNFVNILFVLVGLVGALQYRQRVVITYTVWCSIWLALNILVVCYYLEIGSLSIKSGYLTKWSSDGKTWWQKHEILCNSTLIDTCLIQHKGIEIVQASIQCGLSLLGFCLSAYVTCIYLDDDDSSQPVHDELEYIKMRYRSAAKNSFRTLGRKPQISKRNSGGGCGGGGAGNGTKVRGKSSQNTSNNQLGKQLDAQFIQSSPLLSSCQTES